MPRREAILLVLLAAPAFAQGPTFRPVDPNTSDSNPLAVSQRIIPADLRAPAGFDRVYELVAPWRDTPLWSARSDPAGVFFRASGGLVLSFPRSSYVPTNRGDLPLLPPGATYSLGLPRSSSPRPIARPDPPPGPGALSARALPAGTTGAPAQRAAPASALASAAPRRATFDQDPPPQPPADTSIWLDADYRARRLAGLIDAARLRGATPPAAPNPP